MSAHSTSLGCEGKGEALSAAIDLKAIESILTLALQAVNPSSCFNISCALHLVLLLR
jgi:hypothetical protein